MTNLGASSYRDNRKGNTQEPSQLERKSLVVAVELASLLAVSAAVLLHVFDQWHRSAHTYGDTGNVLGFRKIVYSFKNIVQVRSSEMKDRRILLNE
jgi:hypothetical protein